MFDNIPRQLLHLYQNAPSETALLAERCLLCFVSKILEQGCLRLERNFGEKYNFNCSDLYFIFDDDGKLSPVGDYKCFSRKILQSFDSQQSSLATWAMMRVKQHPELNKFLLERGVHLISDWAILNDTQPKQLERILKEFHTLSHGEIQEAQTLLHSYHTVYRVQRLQNIRKRVRSTCAEPTFEHLQDIAQNVNDKVGRLFDAETVMMKLKKLASQLREYRIYVRGGALPAKSLDAVNEGDYNSLLETIPAPSSSNVTDSNEEQSEFLQYYRHQLQISLQSALAKVTESKVRLLQRKKGDKAQMFLTALELSLYQKFKLRVSDQTGILEERGLDARTSDTYIFTRVVGNWDEKFLVSVSLMDGVETTLPPFAFDLGR